MVKLRLVRMDDAAMLPQGASEEKALWNHLICISEFAFAHGPQLHGMARFGSRMSTRLYLLLLVHLHHFPARDIRVISRKPVRADPRPWYGLRHICCVTSRICQATDIEASCYRYVDNREGEGTLRAA